MRKSKKAAAIAVRSLGREGDGTGTGHMAGFWGPVSFIS